MKEQPIEQIFEKLQNTLKIKLNENEIVCPKCKGLRLILVKTDKECYIENCKSCYNGKNYKCKHCEKLNKTDFCMCKEAQTERNNNFDLKQAKRNAELFEKAEKIDYKDYTGYYMTEYDEPIKDLEYLSEWIYERLLNKDEVPEYLWSTKEWSPLTLDLEDIIINECEDGCEDMIDHLNLNDPLLEKAQELLYKWIKKQGNNAKVYTEDETKAIIITNLINNIKKEIINDI